MCVWCIPGSQPVFPWYPQPCPWSFPVTIGQDRGHGTAWTVFFNHLIVLLYFIKPNKEWLNHTGTFASVNIHGLSVNCCTRRWHSRVLSAPNDMLELCMLMLSDWKEATGDNYCFLQRIVSMGNTVTFTFAWNSHTILHITVYCKNICICMCMCCVCVGGGMFFISWCPSCPHKDINMNMFGFMSCLTRFLAANEK